MRTSSMIARSLAVAGAALLAAFGTIAMVPSVGGAYCMIEGPKTVSVNETFTLCGPQDNDYTYEWHGPGVPAGTRSRCVTVPGRASGSYEYELVADDGVQRERCTQVVRVGGGATGTLTCSITGPTSIQAGQTARLCAPQSSLHSYTWSGPGGFTASTRCVDVMTEGVYEVAIRNTLTGYVRQCNHRLEVAGASQGLACNITGPTTIRSGSRIQLCGPSSGSNTYRWTGPDGFTASLRCVVVTTPGDYFLTVRSTSSGLSERCSHRVGWVGDRGQAQTCTISGPSVIPANRPARLCGQSFGNSSYRWLGPAGFEATSRCIDVGTAGTYELTIRDLSTGAIRECSMRLGGDDDVGQDPDALLNENCPRASSFWRQECSNGNGGDLSQQEMLSIAQRVDERSRYFNWSNDLAGLCQALQPARPLTRRKQVARYFAAMLANISAGELGVVTNSGDPIGLDVDTEVRFRSARTIGQMISSVDQLLMSRTGNFTRVAEQLNAINAGRGIGPVCE
jgi:hypothetical protein